jgi:hypothetical protein
MKMNNDNHFDQNTMYDTTYSNILIKYSTCICRMQPKHCSQKSIVDVNIVDKNSYVVNDKLYSVCSYEDSMLIPSELLFYSDYTSRTYQLRSRLLHYALLNQSDRKLCSNPFSQQKSDQMMTVI